MTDFHNRINSGRAIFSEVSGDENLLNNLLLPNGMPYNIKMSPTRLLVPNQAKLRKSVHGPFPCIKELFLSLIIRGFLRPDCNEIKVVTVHAWTSVNR